MSNGVAWLSEGFFLYQAHIFKPSKLDQIPLTVKFEETFENTLILISCFFCLGIIIMIYTIFLAIFCLSVNDIFIDIFWYRPMKFFLHKKPNLQFVPGLSAGSMSLGLFMFRLNNKVMNTVTIRSLSRQDVDSVLSCRAVNNNISGIVQTSIRLDLLCKLCFFL